MRRQIDTFAFVGVTEDTAKSVAKALGAKVEFLKTKVMFTGSDEQLNEFLATIKELANSAAVIKLH